MSWGVLALGGSSNSSLEESNDSTMLVNSSMAMSMALRRWISYLLRAL